MHLRGFNLNLLVAFDALVNAPTLTEAAQTLSLTQPALSGALKQLRQHYDDPLIIYSTSGSRLTPLAETLAPLVREVLVTALHTIKLSPDFDAATSKVAFDMRATDWIELVFLKDVLGEIAARAPGMTVTVQSLSPRPAALHFADNADIVLTSETFLDHDRPSRFLFEDRFACIAWDQNGHVADGLDVETFTRLHHAGLVNGPDGTSAADQVLHQFAAQRKIAVRTTVHAILPHIVIGTQLLAVTSWRFAEQVAPSLPIRILPLPFPVEPLRISMQWQPYRDTDPAMDWLRTMLIRRAGQIDGSV